MTAASGLASLVVIMMPSRNGSPAGVKSSALPALPAPLRSALHGLRALAREQLDRLDAALSAGGARRTRRSRTPITSGMKTTASLDLLVRTIYEAAIASADAWNVAGQDAGQDERLRVELERARDCALAALQIMRRQAARKAVSQ